MAKPRVFKDEWISRFGPWLEKKDNQGWCTLCSVPLTTKDMGVTAITQHIKTAKHMKNVDSGEKKTQPKLGQFFVKTEAQSHDVWTVKDLTAKAEIVAAMWFCSGNTSFMTADGLVPCFKHMFPDSKIAQFMSLGSNKMSYLIAYGLGPFFAAQTVAEIKKAKAFFTLHFDETMNAQVKKQMDVLVRFWCEGKGEVQVRYLSSIMFGHAKAVDVVQELTGILERNAIHGDVTKVPVTRELLKAAQGAYAMYAAKLQEEREKNRLKEKQDIEKKEKESRKRQAEGRYNDLLQELEGLNKEADIVKEQLAITIDSVKKETAKITAAKGNAMQIAAAANQLEFWGKHQTELSAKLDEIDKKRREKEEEKNAMTKLKKSKH